MALVATAGAANIGGGVFSGSTLPAAPTILGGKCVRIGDATLCPGAAGAGPGGYGKHLVDQSLNRLPMLSTVLGGSVLVRIDGVGVATVGSATSCGHEITTSGTNDFLNVTA